MVTVSHLTKKILQEKPYVHEALSKELINIVALAEMIKPEIEKEMGKVKTSAVSMAIRREMEADKKEFYNTVTLTTKTDLLVKSNLFEISALKSPTINNKLMKLYGLVNYNIGDTLNIIQGNYEVLIISNETYKKKFLQVLKGEKIKKQQADIASLSIKIPKDAVAVPGFYFIITKILAMNNINIIDLVNTETEATLILFDKDISKAYDLLTREIKIGKYEKN